MKCARRFPDASGLVQWTSLCVCFALVLSCLAIVPFAAVTGKSGSGRGVGQGQGNGQSRRVSARPPQPGPPAGKLPNLDEMRSATDNARRHGARPVRAPQPVPSTQRRWWYVQPANRAAAPAAKTLTTVVKANHSRAAAPEPQGGSDMAMARIDPYNRTGTGGVDLLSQNFNWSLGLVGLKGRGLDLGLSLSYNSLSMWTRSGNEVAYNMDKDAAAPGFRLGFPTVQGPYDNSAAGVSFYMLITPSGQHVELRHVGTSSVYQAVDASYSQLTYYDNGTSNNTADDYLIFRAGGSELRFYPMNDEWRCTEVKDRNGNYIGIAYDSSTGNISTVTDTLGRVVTFHYDGYNNIQTITQPWGSATHTWASFGWGTTPIGSGIFSGLTYTGPTKGSSISVLAQVGLADGSKYCFDYDGSYGMVSAIKYYAPDDNPSETRHERRQVTYAYDTSNGKVPRVNSEKDWAENWNGDTNGEPATNGSEEAVTQYYSNGGPQNVT